MEYDVVIIGAGPSGLATAIKIKQLCQEHNLDYSIAILEKGSYPGAHNISGCIMDPSGINELIPNWQELDFPIKTLVTQDKLCFLTKNHSHSLPIPKQWSNSGNYIISLSQLCTKLAEHAESLGVEIYPGFAVDKVLYSDHDTVIGVVTSETGVLADGTRLDDYQEGMEIFAKHIVLAEGCKGSVTRDVIKKFNLDSGMSPKTYGLGIKEIWQVKNGSHNLGQASHYLGYPLGNKAYGGGFMYHMEDDLVAVGLVTALDYKNPYLSPYEEFQQFKLHPQIYKVLKDGKRIEYGARTVDESGIQSLPKLTFPGGVIVGDSAGFLNVAKIKGVHYAIKSGIIAADTIFSVLKDNQTRVSQYQQEIFTSYIYKDLYKVRNIRSAFSLGMVFGMLYAGIDYYIFRGKAPWTFKRKLHDHEKLLPHSKCVPINYEKPDGKVTFDRLSSIYLANLNYETQQPCHLKLKNKQIPITVNLKRYNMPELRYCPAFVYEAVKDQDGDYQLQINATNCLQCKACEIKDPQQNITVTPPVNGSGPQYGYM